MIKIRITGLPGEVDRFLEKHRKLFFVSDESEPYKNSKSRYVQRYIDIEERGSENE